MRSRSKVADEVEHRYFELVFDILILALLNDQLLLINLLKELEPITVAKSRRAEYVRKHPVYSKPDFRQKTGHRKG